jgi:hypothetical protein
MQKSLFIFSLLVATGAWAQDPAALAQQFHQKPDEDGIYYVGPEVSAPKLLSAAPAPNPLVNVISGKVSPEKVNEGMSVFAMVIDAKGTPQHIELLHTNGDAYDRSALASLSSARFVPGALKGNAVPVWVDCRFVFRKDRSPAYPEVLITERDLPRADSSRLDGKRNNLPSYTEPFAVHTVDADFDDPFVRHPYVQVALVSVLVGVDGLPKDVRVARGLGFGLDKKAVDAVWHYRFLPATRHGNPVEARRNVEVKFSLF